jgi:hypothetical protein
MNMTGAATAQATSSQRLWKREFTEIAIMATSKRIMAAGRHCSSCG